MDSKTFYDRILEDTGTFDKMMYDLEKMSKEAPNPRIRTVADRAIADLSLALEICKAMKAQENAERY